MEAKLEHMSLGLPSSVASKAAKATDSKSKTTAAPELADSWDQEDLSDPEVDGHSSSAMEQQQHAAHHGRAAVTGTELPIPNAPPPTPISPNGPGKGGFADWPVSSPGGNARKLPSAAYPAPSSPRPSRPGTAEEERRRPEKTTAAANRMIAGALGVRVPPKTEEQRAYERAVREGEVRKRDREKKEKEREREEEERAKASVWDG